MSRQFGEIRQNGYVVPDLATAIQHWAHTLGVGPWLVIDELPVEGARYCGAPTDARAAIALSFSGDLQIELIQPLNDGPSPYRDFLRECPSGGLQHVSSWPDSADYNRIEAAYLADHGQPLFQGRVGRTRFVYLDTIAHLGSCFEMADLSPGSKLQFEALRKSAAVWDGVSAHYRA